MVSSLITKGQSNALAALPREILLLICDHLAPSGHNNFSRACRYLTWCLQRQLFTRCSSPSTDAGDAATYHEAMLYGCTQPNGYVINRALLYQCPPSINHAIFEGKNALALASQSGQAMAVAYILQRHPAVNQPDSDGLSALSHAIDGLSRSSAPPDAPPHAEIILRLLNAGAEPNCRLPQGLLARFNIGNSVSAIVDAAEDERLSIPNAKRLIEKLIRNGGSVNAIGNSRYSPLCWAADHYDQCSDLLHSLLQNGANPNLDAEVNGHSTALSCIIPARIPQVEKQGVIAKLLEFGANPNLRDGVGRTSFGQALYPRWEETAAIVALLLKHGADPNLTFEGVHYTPLALAIAPQDWAPSVPESERFPSTASHTSQQRLEIAQKLIQGGADVNQITQVPSDLTITPLQLALTSPYREATRPLTTEPNKRKLISANNALSDVRMVESLLQMKRAELGLGNRDEAAITLEDIPQHRWSDQLIPALLRAGAKVDQKLVHECKGTLRYVDRYEAEGLWRTEGDCEAKEDVGRQDEKEPPGKRRKIDLPLRLR